MSVARTLANMQPLEALHMERGSDVCHLKYRRPCFYKLSMCTVSTDLNTVRDPPTRTHTHTHTHTYTHTHTRTHTHTHTHTYTHSTAYHTVGQVTNHSTHHRALHTENNYQYHHMYCTYSTDYHHIHYRYTVLHTTTHTHHTTHTHTTPHTSQMPCVKYHHTQPPPHSASCKTCSFVCVNISKCLVGRGNTPPVQVAVGSSRMDASHVCTLDNALVGTRKTPPAQVADNAHCKCQ